MEDSLGSTLEKIKIQEQDKEGKLKEKREIEVAIASLNKNIRETTSQSEKSEQEQITLFNNISFLRKQIMLEKIHHDALTLQLQTLNKELNDLQASFNEGITNVWEQRSSFCKEIHTASDTYDAWALLIKPANTEPLVESVKKEDTNPMLHNDIRLQTAIERRDNALKERDRIKAEPDNGEEFLRIRNALRYSLEKIEELRK